MQYRILGSLEAERDDVLVDLGGFQQRALLAVLLVARGRTVTLDRLVDELWSDEPPKAAVHTVRVYVSQLRRVLGEAELETRDRGYGLRLEAGSLDADGFEEGVAKARADAAAGDLVAARTGFGTALELWRGPALAEFQDISGLTAEAARLDEMRLGAEEDLVDVQLANGASAALIPRLEALRAANPLRERVTAQLMLALYRSGRQTEALSVFEGTRQALDVIGLAPDETLRRLQRQILQHDAELDLVSLHPASPAKATNPGRSGRWWVAGVGLGVVATIAVAATLASSLDGQASSPPLPATAARPVTLVLGGAPPTAPSAPTDVMSSITGDELTGLRVAASTYHVPVAVDYGNYNADLARAADRSSLVLMGPMPPSPQIATITRAHQHTVYVALGGSIHDAAFGPNVVGMPFDDTEVGYLGGYLSALMAGRGHPSAVAGGMTPEVLRIVSGYKAGVQAAVKGMHPVVTYSGNFYLPPTCERIAEHQINHGSTVVFDIAGGCGFGAIDAAGVRRVDAVGIDTDLSSMGPQVIGSVVKRFDSAVELAVQLEVNHELRPGRNYTLNLGNDGVGLVGIGPQVPTEVQRKLERVITTLKTSDLASSSGH
ncbi:MAG: BTAD domain-containing putative transcriptional regulator [Solirubrobacteraceae bacterium]